MFKHVIKWHFQCRDNFNRKKIEKVMACKIFDQLYGFRQSDFGRCDQFPVPVPVNYVKFCKYFGCSNN
jgi:hypothetical protein